MTFRPSERLRHARFRSLSGAAALAAVGVMALAACAGDADGLDPSPSASDDGGVSFADGEHLNNPFAGATMYVNAEWTANVLATADDYEDSDPELADAMREVSDEPTAVWMDRISAIEGNADGPGLRAHLDAALEQQDGDTPVAVTVVIYDLPGRDCFALASNGELPATDEGLARYESEYIDVLAAIFAEPEYEDLRIVTVIEPDSLPNLVTNASDASCQAADPYYREGIAYALDAFADLPHVYSYLDAAHAGWLGWESNSAATVQLIADVVASTSAGFAAVDGFVTNTANYTPTEEPFLTDASLTVGGEEVRSADFYEFNSDLDEADWTADLYARAVAAGFPTSIGMIIDTSRNGWGGDVRPTAVSDATSVNAYVNASKVDQRTHRGAWCNQSGAGLGLRPQVLPSGYEDSHLDAFLWVKPPGESDGSSTEIDNDEGKSFDPMCDPGYASDRLAGEKTGALADAPLSGKWFAAQFAELVANAYPAVGVSNPPAREDETAEESVAESAGEASDGQGSGDSAGSGSGSDSDSGAESGSDSGGESEGSGTAAGEPGECTATLNVTNSWDGGFQADVTVTAVGDLTGWTVTLPLPSGTSIDALWNGDPSATSGTVKVSDAGWNSTVDAGGTASFGLAASGDAPGKKALACQGAS